MHRRLAVPIALLTLAGLVLAAGPVQAQPPQGHPLGRPTRTDGAAVDHAGGIAGDAVGGGDFDGDGDGAADAVPDAWATGELTHAADAVVSLDPDRITAALTNGTDPQDPGSLGDFDGDGGSADDQLGPLLDYLLSDILGGDDGLQGRINAFVEAVTGIDGSLLGDGTLRADAEMAAATADGPIIHGVGHTPTRPGPSATVTVRAEVVDPNGVGGVDLLYTVDDGPVQRTEMQAQGGDRWLGQIDGAQAGFEEHGDWSYRVVAHDDAWTGQVVGDSAPEELRDLWRETGESPPGTARSALHEESVADVTPPSVEIVETASSLRTGRSWTVRAAVTDNGGPDHVQTVQARYRIADGPLRRVEMTRTDGDHEATVEIPHRPGSLDLTVRAVDDAGNAASEHLSGTILDPVPPRIERIEISEADAGSSVHVDATDNVGVAGGTVVATVPDGESIEIDLAGRDGRLRAELPGRFAETSFNLKVTVVDDAGNTDVERHDHLVADGPDGSTGSDDADDGGADVDDPDDEVPPDGGDDDASDPPEAGGSGAGPTVPGVGGPAAALVLIVAAIVVGRRRR